MTKRTREIGIRVALGATRCTPSVAAVPGILLAVSGTIVDPSSPRRHPVVSHMVWGVSATDPATFIGVIAMLIAIAAVASFIPALTILRLDPSKVLRFELLRFQLPQGAITGAGQKAPTHRPS